MIKFFSGFLMAALLMAGGYVYYKHRQATSAVEAVRYNCPMHPTYVSDKPGDCPICGMKLAPMTQAHAQDDARDAEKTYPVSAVPGYSSVMLSPERIQSMGVTYAVARRTELDQSFRTYGRVAYDETRMHHVHVKFDGYIETLYVNYVGQFVRQGDPLFSIYSPELYATQNEYLLALRSKEQSIASVGNVNLLEAARRRLALWDISDKDVRELETARKPIRALTIYSPVSGYVTAKAALQGLKVTPADNLYDIVDLSDVWILADVYESDLAAVRIGQPAEVSFNSYPGKIRRGRVAFISPTVDPAARTVKIRIELPNPRNELKPDMYADVVIGGGKGTGVVVPESAVIATGARNIVFISRENGLFEPREVTTGMQIKNFWEIRQGVEEGEKVVTGANFLLDSESKLKASVSEASMEHKP